MSLDEARQKAFIDVVGVPLEEFYRLFEQDARRLLGVVSAGDRYTPAQRGLASRALAYLYQGSDAIPDDHLLGHVDDFIILMVAFDELFPDEVTPISAEALLSALPGDLRPRVVQSMELVLRSDESFPAAVLRPPLEKVFEELRRRRGASRGIGTLLVQFLPGMLANFLIETAAPEDLYEGHRWFQLSRPVRVMILVGTVAVVVSVAMLFPGLGNPR